MRMDEMIRHDHFMEMMEDRKFALAQKREERESNSWKGKSEELEYKMKLLEQYNVMKEKYGWDDEQILAFYRNMAEVVMAKHSGKSDE